MQTSRRRKKMGEGEKRMETGNQKTGNYPRFFAGFFLLCWFVTSDYIVRCGVGSRYGGKLCQQTRVDDASRHNGVNMIKYNKNARQSR